MWSSWSGGKCFQVKQAHFFSNQHKEFLLNQENGSREKFSLSTLLYDFNLFYIKRLFAFQEGPKCDELTKLTRYLIPRQLKDV